jgi:hypothetical protein
MSTAFSMTEKANGAYLITLLRFERGHINGEAVLHIGPEQSLVGIVDLLDRDHFYIRSLLSSDLNGSAGLAAIPVH